MMVAPDERLKCLLVGSMLGSSARYLSESLRLYSAVSGDDEFGRAGRAGWINAINHNRNTLANLLPEAAQCDLDPTADIAKIIRQLDTDLRDFGPGFSRRAIDDAIATTSGLIRALEYSAELHGVDPPLIRNIRRIASVRPSEPARSKP